MKKITIISIILILLLNIFIPTIVLAKEDVEKKNITSKEVEGNVTNNNTSTENTTTEDKENTNVSTNITTNSTFETDKKEDDNKNAEKVDSEQKIETLEIDEKEVEKKSTMCIETPASESTLYSEEMDSVYVRGWKMANVSNTSIKAYLDGKEIETPVNYIERPDVIEAITGYGTAEQNKKPGFELNIDKNSLSEGNHEIKIEVLSGEDVLTSSSRTFNYSKEMHIQYQAHVADIGWQEEVKDGETAGTTGRNLSVEALKIELLNKSEENIKIKYEAHVQDIGWQGEREEGETAGTEGKVLHIEALKIELEGTDEYSIMYRAHVQNIGWQDWVEDGEIAGTTGENLGIEAIEIKIVEKEKKSTMYIDAPVRESTFYSSETESIYVKGWKMANVSNTSIKAYLDGKEVETTVNYMERPDVIEKVTGYGTAEQNPKPGFELNIDANNLSEGNHEIKIEVLSGEEVLISSSRTFNYSKEMHIQYQAHIADIGWQEEVKDGETAGTTGKNLEVQALKIELINKPETAHIKYRVYVEGSGWTEYVKDGEQAGTTGQNKKIQAIQIELEGLEGYVVEYQAHVQEIGWQSWASNGMEVGTTIQVFGIEAINIRVVEEKNTVVPSVTYSVHNSVNGWTAYGENGITVGDTTSGVKLDAIKIALGNTENANIKYRVHLQDLGWQDYSYNNGQAGTGKQENGIEAIQMELEGLSGYSIQYRSYVIGQGWQDWVKDGKISGTTGEALQIGAIQIKITIKVDIVTNSNFSQLDDSKYPGYKEALQDLQEQHPNWTILIDYTNLDWNAVLEGEHSLTDKGGARSLTQATGAWRDSTDTKEYEPGWFRASKEAIAYMMDPRNSFDDEYIFQFQELASSEGTYSDIANMIQGTYLTRYEGKLPGTTTASIINTILSSAQQYNISPYHLTSRMIHEQGTNGTPLSEGYVYNGRTVYNLFNIQATGSTNEEIWQNGAAYAYNNHWWSPELCINGSANFLNTSYISRGQSTLYYQKYNVVSYKYYEHQYMTNIRGANDEGKRIGAEYKANGLIDSHFVFTIPVYENMPATKAPRPST